MTDGQWLYLIANITVDDEEEFEKLCSKCKNDSKQSKCSGCGKNKVDHDNNPNFDEEKFNKLKNI